MTNHPSFHTFSGAFGYLMEAERQREADEQNKREQAVIQQQLDDVYNNGVDDYNDLIEQYNDLNRRYKSSKNEEEKYRGIALELAKNYQDFYNDTKSVYDENLLLQAEILSLKTQLNSANSHVERVEVARKKVVSDAINLQGALKNERDQNNRLADLNENLKVVNHNQVMSSKVQNEKLNLIKDGFHKVSSESNREKLAMKYIFTKFRVLKNVVDHLVSIGQLNQASISKVEQVLINKWDTEDSKTNAVTASEAGAFLAIENPDLFFKLKIA